MDIHWNDRYAIGHPLIDAEHQALFRLAHEFAAATDQKRLQSLFMQLYKHTREHFAHEEAVMREIHYPEYHVHTEEHNRMISKLNTISAKIGKNEHHNVALESWINDWIVQHIAFADARLLTFMHTAAKVQEDPPENAG